MRKVVRASIALSLSAGFACTTGGGPGKPAIVATGSGPSSSGSSASSTLAGQAGTFTQGHARIVPIASDGWVARDALVISPEVTLLVGLGGERWLVTTKQGVATPSLDAADQLAPEDLLAVRKGPGGLRFLGRSGTVYEAPSALAPFVTERKPPMAMRAVGAGSAAFVGIGADESIVRTLDGGVTWSKVDLPKHVGVLQQLAFSHDGSGLALIAPQQLLATKDDGASFVSVATPEAGAFRLGLTQEDVPFVDGTAMTVATDGGVSFSTSGPKAILKLDAAGPSLVVAKVTARALELPLGDRPAYLNYGGVLGEGQGALLGDTWLEVQPGMTDDDSDPLDLSIASLGKAGAEVKTTRITGLDHCVSWSLAASGQRVVVGCAHDEDEKVTPRSVLLLARSDDRGKTWKSAGRLGLDTSSGARHLHLTARGDLIVDGVCIANNAPCNGGGLVHIAEGGKIARVNPGVKHLDVQRLVVASDGDHVYAAGTIDDGTLILLRSKDGGRTFVPSYFPQVGEDRPNDTADLALIEEDGKRTLVFHGFGGDLLRYTSTDDGATWQGQQSLLAQIDVELISLAGKRGLVLAHGREFETRDAGVSFQEVKLPPPRRSGEWPNIVCSAVGCLIGERAFRAGWDLTDDAELAIPVLVPPPPKTPVYLAPVICNDDGSLSPLGFVDTIIPDPSRGFAWSTIARDVETNAVTVVAQPRPSKSLSPKSIPLLAALEGEAAIATTSRPEGVTAVRYRVSRKAAGSATGKPPLVPKQTVDVELGWWDSASGAVHKATLKSLEIDTAKYVALESSGILRARASTWIVAGGLYVRPLATKGSEPLYFVSDAGKATLLPTPSPLPPIPLTAFRSAGATLFVGVNIDTLGSRQVFLASLAKDTGASWTSRWLTAWPRNDATPVPPPRVLATSTSTGPIVELALSGDKTTPAAAFSLALHGSDALTAADITALPTYDALDDPPRACASGEGATRFELPWSAGKRRPITITGPKGITRASTDVYVRIPKKGLPCTAAIATSAYPTDNQILVFPDAPDLGVYFKSTSEKGFRNTSATPLSCHFDKGAPLPPGMKTLLGFVLP